MMMDNQKPTLYEWMGGLPVLTRLTRIFYEKYVSQDELLAPLFAGMAPDHPERVATWLGEVFGGPEAYTERYGGHAHMISQHLGKGLSEEQRARWARLICQAADDAGLPTDQAFRSAFVSYIGWGTHLAVTYSAPGANPPLHQPVPHWDWGEASPEPIGSSQETKGEMMPNEPITFTQHIKPLFRAKDRQSMQWAFDLWSYDDVARHVQGISHRLQQGSMPCDGAWPREQVALFQRWMTSGMAR
ncbi:group II truncated hemoglobin [Dictyobacter halimunensis]